MGDAAADQSVSVDIANDNGTSDTSKKPVTFIGTNETGRPIYLHWNMGRASLHCAFQNGGTWDMCSFFAPSCGLICSAENKGRDCCVQCAPPFPVVKMLNPGESVNVAWTGEAWETVEDHCSSCSCYQVIQPASGRYRAEACVYDAYTCGTGDCPEPDANGEIDGAEPSGPKTCYTKEFDVPYSGGAVEIAFK